MMLHEEVFAALSSGSPVQNRVYPDELPQLRTLPASVYQIIDNQEEEDVSGEDQRLQHARVQVDSYAGTRNAAEEESLMLRSLLLASHTLQVVTIGGGQAFEPDTRLYRSMREYSVWFNP